MFCVIERLQFIQLNHLFYVNEYRVQHVSGVVCSNGAGGAYSLYLTEGVARSPPSKGSSYVVKQDYVFALSIIISTLRNNSLSIMK